MTKPRELKEGDRVKITGFWGLDNFEHKDYRHIGKFATVISAYSAQSSLAMPIKIHVDGTCEGMVYSWYRESLRALPRRTKP